MTNYTSLCYTELWDLLDEKDGHIKALEEERDTGVCRFKVVEADWNKAWKRVKKLEQDIRDRETLEIEATGMIEQLKARIKALEGE